MAPKWFDALFHREENTMSDPKQTSSNVTPGTTPATVLDTDLAPAGAASLSTDQPVADAAAPAVAPVVSPAEPIGPVRQATPVSTEQLKSVTQTLTTASENVTDAAASGEVSPEIVTEATHAVETAADTVQQLVEKEVQNAGENVKGDVIDEIDKAVNKVQDTTTTLMDRLKLMLSEAGEELHEGWDEAVDIASNMTKDEKELPEKVALVFSTVGHEVSANYKKFSAFLKKYL